MCASKANDLQTVCTCKHFIIWKSRINNSGDILCAPDICSTRRGQTTLAEIVCYHQQHHFFDHWQDHHIKKKAVNKNAFCQHDSGSLILWMRILNPYHHRHHSHYYLFGVIHRAFWIKNIVIQSSGRCFPSFPCSPCSPNLLHVLHNLWNPDIHYHHRKQHATSFNATVIAINYCISKPLLKIDIHI